MSVHKLFWLVLLTVLALPALAQESGDAAGDGDAAAADPDDGRSERRRRVEQDTADWVEKILEDQRERDANKAAR